mgnify:CR=1 FL=1|tara:strand:+ start:1844 stop:2302 length:459 start_codon:yes stop_codon:yes gene_type:complete
MKTKIVSAITSLFPFIILENFGSISNAIYHLNSNDVTHKSVYISRHIDILILGYMWNRRLVFMDVLFNFLSIIIVCKSNIISDSKYLDVNLIVGLVKSASNMTKLHYIISLYFWFIAFIIRYDNIFGRYSDIAVNLLLCPPQFLLKKYISLL